ncbi:uncharacterized protein LOC129580702 [Paramacrobiotus metropolitanus]|uniref:uncharacterized protein LOC129580702 n=1 Tax=Paramacrobiotus metropolitanus TaxID=2943436 RepID=UPI00244569BF|nr:uncharacterized protein LOC129580702 [Paramacrobiotus metropolitanus]
MFPWRTTLIRTFHIVIGFLSMAVIRRPRPDRMRLLPKSVLIKLPTLVRVALRTQDLNLTNLNDGAVATDACYLERWNKELPFSELPHMLLTFLSSDDISGSSEQDKLSFFTGFLNKSQAAYIIKDSKSKVFDIPTKYSKYIAKCPTALDTSQAALDSEISLNATNVTTWNAGALVQWNTMVKRGDRAICGVTGIQKPQGCKKSQELSSLDPFYVGVDQLIRMYGDTRTYSKSKMLKDVIQAAKHCYNENSFPDSARMIPCLDFAIGSGQMRNLSSARSIFGNEEICQKFLASNLDKCPSAGECTQTDIININVFVRNYFLCAEPVDQTLLIRFNRGYVPRVTDLTTVSSTAVSLHFLPRLHDLSMFHTPYTSICLIWLICFHMTFHLF